MIFNGNLARDFKYDNIENFTNVIRMERHNNTLRRKQDNVGRKSTEVYPFKTEEEIKSMLDVIDKHIAESKTDYNKKRWCRNKLIFLLGINLGIRGSDLCELRWNDIFYDNFEFREKTNIQPIKTRNTSGKYVSLFFNDTAKTAIKEYIELYPIKDINGYVFESKRTSDNGSTHIDRISIGRMLKSVAKECGIKRNINSHSLRKTFGYQVWHNANNKDNALSMLQYIFGHSSQVVTQRYIGVEDEEIMEVYNSLDAQLNL